jgi:tetratricopeptide (TPR) repeat protein
MPTILSFLIILLVFGGVGFVLLKGKSENKDSSEKKKATSEKSAPKESSAYSDFSKKKEVLKKTLAKSLKSRAAMIPLLKIPPAPEHFIGRKNIIADVKSRIGKNPALIGLYGHSGVGKTALGLVMTQSLLPDFPDEPIFLDMRGTSAKPLDSGGVMIRVMNLLSPKEKFPETEEKRTQRYRTLLKRRKSVLFLDNVPGGMNLTDLLPPRHCALITTSIQPLKLPHLISKKLNPLDPKDAQALLLQTSPRTGFWANEISKMCVNFPLALTLFGKYISSNSQTDTPGLIENLGGELKSMNANRSDEKQVLKLIIALSYRSLSEKAAAVLRKLTLFPDTFDDKAETFLCEDPDSEHLVQLLTLGLVTSNNNTNRFSLHDQVRRFLGQRLKESEQAIADKRFATYFLTVVMTAGESFSKGGKEKEQGLNQFDLEWENIKKGQQWALSTSDNDEEADNICLSYTEAAVALLELRQPPAERLKWYQAALESSRRLNESEVETKYLLLIGIEHNRLNQSEEALDFLGQALKSSQESNDFTSERIALGQLGLTQLALGRSHRAIEYLEKELSLLRKSEDAKGEETILENLGGIYSQVGEYDRAIEYHKEELELARKLKDSPRQGRVLGDLGKIYASQGNHSNAIEYFEEGLTLVQKFQDKKGEIALYGKLGDAYTEDKKFKKALETYQQGLTLARESKDQKNVARMLEQMGQANLKSGNLRDATSCFQKALTLFQKTGDKAKEGETLWNLAQTMGQAEKTPEAIHFAEAALALYQKIKRLDKNVRKEIETRLKQWQENSAEGDAEPAASPKEAPVNTEEKPAQ